MTKVPPLQLAREMAEFVMTMNANSKTFSSGILDELAILHQRMKLEMENPQKRTVASREESFTVNNRELVGTAFD